ncbi:type IV toxin-antitoxin system AbiEi family antitoxin domain-containing protein [Arthrobacter sp. HLT1-20]
MRCEELRVGAYTVANARKPGLPSLALDRLREAGKIEQIGPGLYRDIDSPAVDLEVLEIAYKAPQATICLSSALARHELIDMIAGKIDVTLPCGSTGPITLAPVNWHYFQAAPFDVECTTIEIPGE